MALLGRGQVVDDDFGRANHLRPALITTLNDAQNCMVGLGRIMALRKRFLPMRVERFADDRLAFHAMLVEQLLQLLERHLHSLTELGRILRGAGGQGAFKVINDRQEIHDERFLLRDGPNLGFLAAAPLEILEVGAEAQMQVLLFGQILEERFRLGDNGFGGNRGHDSG